MREPRNTAVVAPRQGQAEAEDSLLYPLSEFYERAGMTLPPVREVEPAEVPEPFRSLLVHQSDMTSTLEQFHGERIHLHPWIKRVQGDAYYRAVLLLLEKSLRPVEFGAIRIHLDLFPAAARQLIVEARRPLGRILNESGLVYASRPRAFLRIASDTFIQDILKFAGHHQLFGRRNTLYDQKNRPLAEIVEILPPEGQDPNCPAS